MSDEYNDSSDNESTAYLYRIPVEVNNGVREPKYDLRSYVNLYLHHTGPNELVVITDKGLGHFHRDDVDVEVVKLDESEVAQCDDRLAEYV